MLEPQISNDGCKYFCLACARRTLHKGDSLPTSVYNRILLTLVVDRHTVVFELEFHFGPVENTQWYCFPQALLNQLLGRADGSILRQHVVFDCGNLVSQVLGVVPNSEVQCRLVHYISLGGVLSLSSVEWKHHVNLEQDCEVGNFSLQFDFSDDTCPQVLITTMSFFNDNAENNAFPQVLV